MNITTNISCESDEVSAIISRPYKCMIIGQIALSSLALIPNILLLSIIRTVTVLPANLRLLLGQFSFSLLWMCLGNIIKNGYILSTPLCAFTFSQRSCKIFHMILVGLASSLISFSLVSLCIERVVATVMCSKYEKRAWYEKPYLALGLITFELLIIVGPAVGGGIFESPNDRYLPICDIDFMPRMRMAAAEWTVIYIVLELIALVTCVIIYFYNRHIKKNMAINRARYGLSARFMIDQNVQITAILAPSMVLHAAVFISAASVFAYNVKWKKDTRTGLITHAAFFLCLIYAIIHPTLAFCVNCHLRRQLLNNSWAGRIIRRWIIKNIEKIRGKWGKADRHQIENNMTTHFEYLDNAWAAGKPPGSEDKNRGQSKIAWGKTQTTRGQ